MKVLVKWSLLLGINEKNVNSNYAIAAWALCVRSEIREDVKNRLAGDHRIAIEGVIQKLYSHNFDANVTLLIDTFWDEHKSFMNETGVFAMPSRWNVPDAIQGNSHLWHEKYSLPYT